MITGTFTIAHAMNWNQDSLCPNDLLVNAPVTRLLTIYNMWRMNELRELAHAHEIKLRTQEKNTVLRELLADHTCHGSCPTIMVVFRALQKARTGAQVNRVYENMRGKCIFTVQAYTDIASNELQHLMISEWQNTLSTDKFKNVVCAPCGRRTLSNKAHTVPRALVDLTLLRNDGLPQKVMPTTYNLSAYNGAILNPKGLTDVMSLGDINMCNVCYRDLVTKK